MANTKQTIGVVLAGGRSSRMGQDKALLTINEQSLLNRTVAMLKQTSVEQVVVSRNDGKPEHIADTIPNKGPLSGIHSAAHKFPNKQLLILPVDLPLISADIIQALIDEGKIRQQNVRYEKQNLPLFINNTPEFRRVLTYIITQAENLSVNALCRHFPLYELVNTNTDSMFNTNTPEQWEFAVQQLAPRTVIPTKVGTSKT